MFYFESGFIVEWILQWRKGPLLCSFANYQAGSFDGSGGNDNCDARSKGICNYHQTFPLWNLHIRSSMCRQATRLWKIRGAVLMSIDGVGVEGVGMDVF